MDGRQGVQITDEQIINVQIDFLEQVQTQISTAFNYLQTLKFNIQIDIDSGASILYANNFFDQAKRMREQIEQITNLFSAAKIHEEYVTLKAFLLKLHQLEEWCNNKLAEMDKMKSVPKRSEINLMDYPEFEATTHFYPEVFKPEYTHFFTQAWQTLFMQIQNLYSQQLMMQVLNSDMQLEELPQSVANVVSCVFGDDQEHDEIGLEQSISELRLNADEKVEAETETMTSAPTMVAPTYSSARDLLFSGISRLDQYLRANKFAEAKAFIGKFQHLSDEEYAHLEAQIDAARDANESHGEDFLPPGQIVFNKSS